MECNTQKRYQQFPKWLYFIGKKICLTKWINCITTSFINVKKGIAMYKHKARMTARRREILILIAKGYNNKQIARKMGLSLSNTRLQKWRLYCYLGEIHTAIDAVIMGLQMGFLKEKDLSDPIKEDVYASKVEKQIYSCT